MKLKTKRFKPANPRQFNKKAALVVAGVVTVVGVIMLFQSRAATICNIDPANSDEAINAAINGCANGSTIVFPAGKTYNTDSWILVKNRDGLTIDGNGSTFKSTADGSDGNKALTDSVWMVLSSTNITLKNMTAIGTFDYLGQKRSLATISPDPRFTEANPAYGVYGSRGVYLEDLKAFGVWGDGVTTGPAHYADPQATSSTLYSHDVFMKRMHVRSVGRMCWGPTSGTNIWIEDSLCEDAWYGGIDAELDSLEQPLQGHHYLRNTFNGFNHLGIFIPVAANSPQTKDVEIRGNRFLTYPDLECSSPIHIGGYPDSNPAIFYDIVTENNEGKTKASLVVYDHVQGGSVQNNKLLEYTEAGCAYPDKPPLVKQTNSSNVTVANNGPDAAGAGAVTSPSPSPSPTTPPPSPSPTPSPTPTPPPSSSTCPVPASFAGTAGPAGSGRYDFTWSAATGATEYNLYYALPPDAPATIYAGPFTVVSGSAFSLTLDKQYNFAVRASCSGTQSANSNMLTVTAPSGSTTPPPPPADTTKPSAPTGLTATAASSTKVDLKWTASTDNVGVSKYLIQRGGTVIAEATGTTYSDTTASPNTSYSYVVMAVDAAANTSDPSNTASVTTPNTADTTKPSAPTNVTASIVSATQVNLSWTASTDNVGVASYRVLRNGTQVATVTTTSYGESGLTAGTSYNYTVVAYDAAGNPSDQSNTATVTTPSATASAKLLLTPASSNVRFPGELRLEVRVDTPEAVNAVEANLTYPAAQFDYVGIDSTGSAFPTVAQGTGANGSITIARGTGGGQTVSGNQLVATIVLKAKTGSGTAAVSYAGTSQVLRASDNTNILSTTIGGSYKLLPKQGDASGDGRVSITDLSIVLSTWGSTIDLRADFNGNGKVDITDLSILLSKWEG